MTHIQFFTDYRYTDRITKAKFVYEKYKSVLKGSVLDVGADQGYLRQHLPSDVRYVGLGRDVKEGLVSCDLEKEAIPFSDSSVDMVLCLDVLEHLDNMHAVFDDLCRVTKRYLLISLPNPWRAFMWYLENGPYKDDVNIKFYGLPKEPPQDRHKWFFSSQEAREFVLYRSRKNGLKLLDVYVENSAEERAEQSVVSRRSQVDIARDQLFKPNLNWATIYEGTQWYLLEKEL